MVANNRCFSNEIRFRKTSPIPKRITWREDPTGGVPPRPPPAHCRQGSSQFLVIRIVRGPASSGSAILTGQAQSCIIFRALPIGSLGTTITGAFWVEPWADQLRLNIRRSSNVGLATHCRTLCVPIFASRLDSQRRILASAVPSHSPTTEELLKRAEDPMREDCAYLKDFNAAVDALQKRQAEFQTEHPAFGRHS